MKLRSPLLEEWMREYYFSCGIDIGSSGVQPFSMAELRGIAGISREELDEVVFKDSTSLGASGLRLAIARQWGNGNLDWVMATHGSSEAIYLIMRSLLNPGDEIVCISPCYPQLYLIAESIGCHLKPWPLRPENQFVPDFAELKPLLGPQTRMIIVNFPHNPTGATITRAQQDELIAQAAHAGVYLIWDAAFADLVYDAPALPNPELNYDRAVTIGTLSKGFGLPGLRVGWCMARPDVLSQLLHLRDYITLHLSPLVELVARRAIENAGKLLDSRLPRARQNRAIVSAFVKEHEELIDWVEPRGGVCGFPRLRNIPDTELLCRALARKHGVLLVPGNCFEMADRVRLGFGGCTEQLNMGIELLAKELRIKIV